MSQDTKELAEIKGYVARLYQMVRGRTQMALELTEEQTEQTAGVGETIDEINTNLQIANSFQQEEIYNKLTDVETLLKKIIKGAVEGFKVEEEEKFNKVEEWMAFGLATGHSGMGDIIAFVIEESENSYKIKTPFKIEIWRGPRWVKRAFEPMLLDGDPKTVVTIDKNKVFTYYKPSEVMYNELMDSHAYNSEYNPVVDPWKQRNELPEAKRGVTSN